MLDIEEATSFSPKAIARRMKKIQDDAYKALQGNSDQAASEILSLLQDVHQSIQQELRSLPRGQFKAFHLKRIQDAIDQAIAQFKARAEAAISGHVLNSAKLGEDYWKSLVKAMRPSAGTTIGVAPVISDQMLSVISNMSVELVKGLSDEVAAQTKSAIQRAVLGEETPFTVANQLSTIIGPRGNIGAGASADRIVRTEVGRAFSIADDLMAQDIQDTRPEDLPKIVKVWIATFDTRTRDDHVNAHKQVRDLDDDFRVGGEDLGYPRDPSGSAANTINCRCVAIHVPENILDETLSIYPGDKGGDDIPRKENTNEVTVWK